MALTNRPSFIPLECRAIRHHLDRSQQDYPLYVFSEIRSTNTFLKELPVDESLVTLCCAEKQTEGRGRLGRIWVSPFGDNIYLSMRIKVEQTLSNLNGLSLLVSLAILDSLEMPDLKIKWPNDILWQGKKLCGVLIESFTHLNKLFLIIGIGLNVNASLTDTAWCSLHDITENFYDRNLLIGEIIKVFSIYFPVFLQTGFSTFKTKWATVDYLLGRDIVVKQASRLIQGIAKGVDSEGRLCLKDELGMIHHLSSGETTLKTYPE